MPTNNTASDASRGAGLAVSQSAEDDASTNGVPPSMESSPSLARRLAKEEKLAAPSMTKSSSALSLSRIMSSSSGFFRRSKTDAEGEKASSVASTLAPSSSSSSSSSSEADPGELKTHSPTYYMTEALVHQAVGDETLAELADKESKDIQVAIYKARPMGTHELECALLLIWRQARESKVNRLPGFFVVRAFAEFLDNLKADMERLDEVDLEDMGDTIGKVLGFYMDVYSFFKTENERSLVLRILNDNIAAAQLNNFLDLLLRAGEIIRTSIDLICHGYLTEIQPPKRDPLPASLSIPDLYSEEDGSATPELKPSQSMDGVADNTLSPPGMTTSASMPARPRPPATVLGAQRPITYRGTPAAKPALQDAHSLRDVTAHNMGTAWVGHAHPVRLRYPSITPAQYEKVKNAMRKEYGEMELQSQLTHLRFFMLGATRVINYKVVEFLRDEGSHIPKALRVLEMKK
ncbi:hypothetical protein K523DRAFT_376229 [Schizophyllum commune Tattone D]|nr:hypothetical protein K523DRAFT_376229 [Schizophyllum commune Tattone D]